MSASKSELLKSIMLILRGMSKTSTSLSSQIKEIKETANVVNEKVSELETTFTELARQHLHLTIKQETTANLQRKI